MNSKTITISGTGKPDAKIGEDISFGFDKYTTVDKQGHWQMLVALDKGLNQLAFYPYDDHTKELYAHFLYEPKN